MQNRYKFKLDRFYKLFDIKPIQLMKVYKCCVWLFKAIILILLEKILRIMAIITLPLWKLKPIQRFLSDFDELIEKITNW